MSKEIDLSQLAEKWPSTIVARSEAKKFSGGMVSSGTLANLDCKGKGPDGGIKIGRKKGYTVESFIRWLEERAS